MKTLKDVKTRVRPGTRLLCVDHSRQPKLIGLTRTVSRVGVSYFVSRDALPGKEACDFWTHWGRSRDLEILDADTFRMGLCFGTNPTPEVFVTLRFVKDSTLDPPSDPPDDLPVDA